MIKMKAIKPGPFREEAIFKRLEQAVDRTMDRAEKEFKKTYVTWTHKPKWVKIVQVLPRGIRGRYYTVDQIYHWINEGTGKWGPAGQPYKIPKDPPKLLVFPSISRPKTKPGVLHSSSGYSGGPTVFVFGQIEHPGIEPRKFDVAVAAVVQPWFTRWGKEALRVGARESGHSM